MPYDAEFRLSITRALRDQLADSMAGLDPDALSVDNIEALRPRPGVYQLYHRGQLVYIGKSDIPLPTRLARHHRKVSGRTGISPGEMEFKCLYVEEDLSAVAPETLLIQRHRGAGEIPWNHNGFGSNDPGKERDTTTIKADHFDTLYPIDLEWPCRVPMIAPTIGDVLKQLSQMLPYKFRYQAARSPRTQPKEYSLPCPAAGCVEMTADELFGVIVETLPRPWQITALPGYVIMYRANKKYASAVRIYAS
ncbi:GIY-YIG nuclease family protein [Amycolatopsis sp. cg13]|uniref:GIY-YIG nuclease family protein n=1 Tax=Amycolatopsis sp. cg13 TaxID=3238807 RepID=UPI003523B483